MIPNWSPKTPEWSLEEQNLLPNLNPDAPTSTHVSLNTILQKSQQFVRKFPVDTNRCQTLTSYMSEQTLTRNINSAYPIVHENILHLYAKYILHKRQYGNNIEKQVYKEMNLFEFINRLLTKRAVSFYGKQDKYSLLNGKKGSSSWETIGTTREKEPLILRNCLSYEEVKLSAFLSVSSYTYFINVGDRKNLAVYNEQRESIQDEGIIIGVIGPRLVKKDFMDYQELIITENQNTNLNGYGKVTPPTIHQLFTDVYEEDDFDYNEVQQYIKNLHKNIQRYTAINKEEILDNFVYYKRLLFTLDTLLLEANERGLQKGTTAYIHMVGIGLGLWKKSNKQIKIFMDACAQRIQMLGKNLHNVSDICFAYIDCNTCGSYKDGDVIPIEGHPLNGIKIYICKREPHEKLTGADSGKLLVVSYAWDGNALPGNEYWDNKLGSSGDSAAASSTQITELHNPFINAKVSAVNTMIVTGSGVVSLLDYMKSVKTHKRKSETS